MKVAVRRSFVRLGKTLVYGLVGGIGMLVGIGIYALNQKPDLDVWHTAALGSEFSDGGGVRTFAEYLELEERLFAELESEVYERVEDEDRRLINRYHRGSLADPGRWSTDWNRTFEMAPESGEPLAGVLLLHGLSDSPYSLRHLGERLRAAGAHVVGFRIPGHGTAPAGLVRTGWEDMAAAVPLAARHLAAVAADKPLFLVGYSNGGALAVHYALTALEDGSLPRVDRMVLISPEIGITPMAAMAIWQERASRVLGLDKLAWQGIQPEYDPFKYSSFPVNAGNLAYRLTGANRAKVARLHDAGGLSEFPPTLAFQSAVDATVSAPALVVDLFAKLPENGHELVVFDLDRTEGVEEVLRKDPLAEFESIAGEPGRAFRVVLVTNADPTDNHVVAKTWEIGSASPVSSPLGLAWPDGVYSLSHVSLPFPESDPLYGGAVSPENPGIQIGTLALRGERGVLYIPPADMLRQRWNPFYTDLEGRALAHFGLVE